MLIPLLIHLGNAFDLVVTQLGTLFPSSTTLLVTTFFIPLGIMRLFGGFADFTTLALVIFASPLAFTP